MSSRVYNPVQHTQIRETVRFPLLLKGAGASAPVFVCGDTIGASSGTHFTITRSGTGTYSLVSRNAFPYCCKAVGALNAATPAVNSLICIGVPTKNSTTNVWTVPVQVYLAGSPADLTANDMMSISVEFSNSKTPT